MVGCLKDEVRDGSVERENDEFMKVVASRTRRPLLLTARCFFLYFFAGAAAAPALRRDAFECPCEE